MHIPAKDRRAESKSGFHDAQEFLFRHNLASKDAIAVDPRDFDFDIASEELGKGFESDHFGSYHAV